MASMSLNELLDAVGQRARQEKARGSADNQANRTAGSSAKASEQLQVNRRTLVRDTELETTMWDDASPIVVNYDDLTKGRARYRPIDDCTPIVFFFLDEVCEVELRKFSVKKKEKNIVGIRTHVHSFNGPVQLPLAHRDKAAELCLNHSFIIQLFLAFPVS